MTEQSRICLLAVCHIIRPWLFLFPLSRTNCQRYTFIVRRERIFLLLIVRYLDEKLPEVDATEDVQSGKAEKKRKEINGSNAKASPQHPVLRTGLISPTESYPKTHCMPQVSL